MVLIVAEESWAEDSAVPVTGGRRAALVAGLVLAVALVAPPVEAWGEDSLTAHMGQHVLLIGLAAPLVAVGAPVLRRRWGPALVAVAVVVHTVVVLGWRARAVRRGRGPRRSMRSST